MCVELTHISLRAPCGLAQGVWLDNPYNASIESGGAVEVVSVYFLDTEVEGSEHYVGEVPYTSSFLTTLEEAAFTETSMVRGFATRSCLEVSATREESELASEWCAAHLRVLFCMYSGGFYQHVDHCFHSTRHCR